MLTNDPPLVRSDLDDFSAEPPIEERSAGEQLEVLGWATNAKYYRTVHLAAQYDDELEWFRQGIANPALGIAQRLEIHSGTAREWIRVGHSLRYLPLVDAAFAANELSYAKVRIITRWANDDNEAELLDLAYERSAARLTTAIARALDEADDDGARDARHCDLTNMTSYTDGDGMTIVRMALPPLVAKPILAAVDDVVGEIARTPVDRNPSADGFPGRSVTNSTTKSGQDPSADGSGGLAATHQMLYDRWLPREAEEWIIPTLGQQRAHAFLVLFHQLRVDLTTEIVVHVRGDGNTLDDGTPITNHAIGRQLNGAFIRLLIHDAERNPVNASSRRRHPTTKQTRFVMEKHNHECVDCQSTMLIEIDHNPPYEQTQRTLTDELEPRCAPCHRARHRQDPKWTGRCQAA